MTALFVSAVRSWFAAPIELHRLPEFDGTAQAQRRYNELAADFTAYRVADGPIWRSGAEAARATLAASPTSVDMLIYVSQNDPDTVAALSTLTTDLGLDFASVVAVSGHECSNLGPALQIAADVVTAGRADSVLVVLADHAGARGRLMNNGLSVFSDGACAFVVGRHRPTDVHFELLGVDLTRTDGAGTDLLATARAAQESVGAVLRACKLAREDIVALAFANYRWDAQRFLAAAARCPPNRLLRRDVADVAHCFSADVPVKLAAALADGELADGDLALGLVTGPWSWSTIALRAHAATE